MDYFNYDDHSDQGEDVNSSLHECVLDICYFFYATTLSKKQYATNCQNWPKSRVLDAKVHQLEKSTPQL